MLLNRNYDTPFHVAARHQNPATLNAMLDAFPTRCSLVGGDASEELVAELLSISARRGNAPAVAKLIHRGADLDTKVALHLMHFRKTWKVI